MEFDDPFSKNGGGGERSRIQKMEDALLRAAAAFDSLQSHDWYPEHLLPVARCLAQVCRDALEGGRKP